MENLKITSRKSTLFWHFLWSIFRSPVLTSEFLLNNSIKLIINKLKKYISLYSQYKRLGNVQIHKNKGPNGTNHGQFRQLQTFKTVADCQVSYSQLVCQSVSKSVSKSVHQSVSQSARQPVMRKSWKSHEKVMSKSWSSQEQFMNKLWASNEQVMSKSWASHEQVMSKSWASHRQFAWKFPESYKKF